VAEDFRFNEREMDDLFESTDGPVAKELTRISVRVERGAKRLCPVDTGRLRASITHSLERDSQGLVAKVGTNVDYAGYVELGTSRAPAQPFLRPALAEVIR
jgi:HK97 gp10 family phage protein